MSSRSLGHRAPLLWIVLPLMAGIVTGRHVEGVPLIVQLALALFAAGLGVIAGFRHHHGWAYAIAVAGFFAGSASYELHRLRIRAWDSLPPREARVAFRVERVFSQADPKRVSGLGRITRSNDPVGELEGQRIYFSCNLRPGDAQPRRSAVIVALGVLSPLPSSPPANTFDGYLASAGANFRVTRARIVGEDKPQHPYYRFCDDTAARFRNILGTGIASKRPALAGLLRAMMLGETRELTEDQQEVFMQSGTMHLFAISGLNIGVICAALQALLVLARLPLWARFMIGTPLLWLFVDITGAAPSAVRAFAMAVFANGAFAFRKPASPFAAIIASAAVVLVVAPLQVFSASFIMSYAIVVSLLLLGLPMHEACVARWSPWRDLPKASWTRLQKIVHWAFHSLSSTIAIGVATMLVSLITSIQYFQLLTPGAFFANLVLIPAAIVVTLGGFVSLVCGMVGLTTGVLLSNHTAALVLLIIESLVRWSVTVPGAFVAAEFRAPWVGGVAVSALLTAMLLGYRGNWQREAGGWWPPFALVAVTLLAGVKYGG